jgi:glycosyltransferase involved in cell wall biosynthesis
MTISVCVVTQQYKSIISGIGLHARCLLSGLSRAGHKVALLTQANQYSAKGIPEGVEIFTVPNAFWQNSQARWIPLAWHFARKLRQISAVNHFDIVHFTDAREAFWFAGHHPGIVGNINDYYAAHLQPFSYYRRYYYDAEIRWLYYLFLHKCEQKVLPRLRALIANSEYTRIAVKQAYKIDSSRLFKCFKCIDLSNYNCDLFSRDYTDGPILFVGGNMQRKGLTTLIQASQLVIAEYPSIKFYIVGQDTKINIFQKMVYQLGVENNFEFLGWISNEQLISLYRQARIFVMPSLMEAFGVALLEAMACGTPVVATRVGGIPEFIEHGNNGLLVEPGNPEELANALLSILKDIKLATHLGRQGRLTAQCFGIEQMLECTYRVYRSLL